MSSSSSSSSSSSTNTDKEILDDAFYPPDPVAWFAMGQRIEFYDSGALSHGMETCLGIYHSTPQMTVVNMKRNDERYCYESVSRFKGAVACDFPTTITLQFKVHSVQQRIEIQFEPDAFTYNGDFVSFPKKGSWNGKCDEELQKLYQHEDDYASLAGESRHLRDQERGVPVEDDYAVGLDRKKQVSMERIYNSQFDKGKTFLMPCAKMHVMLPSTTMTDDNWAVLELYGCVLWNEGLTQRACSSQFWQNCGNPSALAGVGYDMDNDAMQLLAKFNQDRTRIYEGCALLEDTVYWGMSAKEHHKKKDKDEMQIEQEDTHTRETMFSMVGDSLELIPLNSE